MEMSADWFKVAVVFAVDIACLVSSDLKQQQAVQRERSTGKLFESLRTCLNENDRSFGTWVNESARIQSRMEKADREGGVKVWAGRFLDSHSPLLHTNQNHAILVDGKDHVHEDGRLDASGRGYRGRCFFRRAGYRLTPEAAFLGSYQADFLDNTGYAISDVIHTLSKFREDAFGSFHHFLRDFFGNPYRRRLLERYTGLSFDRASNLTTDELGTFGRWHQLVFMKGFWQHPEDGGPRRWAPLGDVTRSGELAGILTEAPWFGAYGSRYIENLRAKEIGHRGDEIYVVGNHTTVVVAERFWNNLFNELLPDNAGVHRQSAAVRDPLYWYQADLLTMIEHHLSRLALLRQQLAFFRDRGAFRALEAERPADALPLVLDGRTNLTQVTESLDFTSLARHGFTREFATVLRREMGLDAQLAAVRQRIGDMSEAVNLKSSVTSAKAQYTIQAAAFVIAVIALLVSVVALIASW